MTSHERLRTGLLISGLFDEIPLAEVESLITRDELAKTVAAQQNLALETIRYQEPGAWSFAVWLKLTDVGRRLAKQLQAQRAD
jgi:hypothetical protein